MILPPTLLRNPPAHSYGLTAVVEFSGRDLVRVDAFGALSSPEVQREEKTLVDFQWHVDQLLLCLGFIIGML